MKGMIRVALSACYASLLALGVLLVEGNNFTHWAQVSPSQRFWAAFAFAYAIALSASGWIYLRWKTTSAGLLHAALMLAIAGMVVVAVEAGGMSSPARDDASAWIAADTTFVLFVGGAIAALFGILVMCRVFTGGVSQQNAGRCNQEKESNAEPS
jgi:hypothetical protein